MEATTETTTVSAVTPAALRTVTVLIAARNEAEALPETLESIAAQTRQPNRVLVVDDGSVDLTAFVASLAKVDVLSLSQSSGKKSGAQQAGLAGITTDLIVVVDADTVLPPDTLEKLLAPFEGENPPDAACGFVLPKQRRSIWQKGRAVEYYFGQHYYKKIQSIYNCVVVASGCIAAYRTEVVRAVGGFLSPSLAEDMDLTWRIITAKRNGKRLRVAFVPEALALTIDPPSAYYYVRQVWRWYAAFFQNVARHWKALVTWKNPMLTVWVGFTLADGIGGSLLFVIWPLYIALARWQFGWWWLAVGLQFLLEMLLAAVFGIVAVRKLRRAAPDADVMRIWQLLLALPMYLITNAVNRVVFIFVFIREVLLRRIGVPRSKSWIKSR